MFLARSSAAPDRTGDNCFSSSSSCSTLYSSHVASPTPPPLSSSWVTFSFHLAIFPMGLASARRGLRVATAAWRLTGARSSSRQTALREHRCSRMGHGSVGLSELPATQTVDEGGSLSCRARQQFVYLRDAAPSTSRGFPPGGFDEARFLILTRNFLPLVGTGTVSIGVTSQQMCKKGRAVCDFSCCAD